MFMGHKESDATEWLSTRGKEDEQQGQISLF